VTFKIKNTMNQPDTYTAVNPILETAFENHEVRIFGTVENPLFVRSDLGEILELVNVRKLDLDPQDLVSLKVTSGGQIRELTCVTEMGLYDLIFRSRTEAAKRFRRWVCEVIREIRLKGYYIREGVSPAGLEIERARMALRAAELKLEAERLAKVARSMQLPERPEGWKTIGEYVDTDHPPAVRQSLIASLGNTLAKAPHCWVRDKYRKPRKCFAPTVLNRAMDRLADLPGTSVHNTAPHWDGQPAN